ncbi:Protein unc-93 A [Araneus ventricosus]|uniref:Protein unc-93 A n=1 Tax=Araneus ventricosus TaxID=182803 RepID=A0A4Y2CE00_ARAVE|nr:Protein unc-93 A [Araneus ventricosus]
MDKTGYDVFLPDVAEDGLGQNPSINKDERYLQQEEDIKIKELRRRSLRNLFIFNTCYVLVYTGFWALSNLQSTMNAAGGIGDYSQAVIYICSMISSLFLPKFLIEKFGCKNILVVGTVICCFSIASNMFLRWDVMITASVAFGLINGPYASAQTFYIDEMATRFQSTISENIEFIMGSFFGLFMFFSESTQIWGNVIAYYSLMKRNPVDVNTSLISECGSDFLPSDNDSNTNLDPPTEEQRFVLVGAYLAMGLVSILIMVVFMDPLKNDLKEGSGWRSTFERFVSAFKQLLKPQQFLLVPLSIYIGMEGPFYGNEFTEVRQCLT